VTAQHSPDFAQRITVPQKRLGHRPDARRSFVTVQQGLERGADSVSFVTRKIRAVTVWFECDGNVGLERIRSKDERLGRCRQSSPGINEGDKTAFRVVIVDVEHSPHVVERKQRRRSAEARSGTVAAPLPRLRVVDETCFDWVQHDVPQELKKVLVPVNEQRLESTLQYVADAVVSAIE
jgi:hypothetical protein